MFKKERGLGRGLDALFSLDNNLELGAEEINQVEIGLIIPRDDQPRKDFNIEGLEELSESIKTHGILQPVLVRPLGDKYEIIAGERRYRAAKLAHLELLPVVIMEANDNEVTEIALIENLQREDLSIVEEALAYQGMIDKFGYVQEVIAQKVGKSRTHVANTLRILKLPEEILKMIEDKEITAGHARTLLGIENTQEQIKIAEQIAVEKLSVREAEQKAKSRKGQIKEKPVEIVEIEDKLQKHFGTKAKVMPKQKGGSIQISYFNQDDLQRILEILGII
ncbi:MAG TPA: ParB/RepB/Spo0J family partition protein [Syntrophomonadaceae bacterium]|nr:ParB/RepB/Spo0J family partition protein [Syntrophomonadaceae bacterium]